MASAPDPSTPFARRLAPRAIDSPDMRSAGRELLSLALIDARNRTLHLLSMCEDAAGQGVSETPRRLLQRSDPSAIAAIPAEPAIPAIPAPLWLAGHIGWFSEWWIGRNTQRAFGIDCPARPTRLATIEPHADHWWHPQAGHDDREAGPADQPDATQTRAYLLETLECTLDLLERAAETDAGLYFYRLALFHEDLRAEQMVASAQTRGLAIDAESASVAATREPLLMPATRWSLGRSDEGFAFAQDVGAEEVDVPEFEIDAQPVSWNQFAEFVDDGGYDRAELWRTEGLAWLAQQQPEGRRAPRHVDQIGIARHGTGGAVLLRRFGRTVRAAGHHSAVHLTWWEADAWARWAGRRIATEVEWEVAAHGAAHRGFRWGDVHEWTAGTLRPFPGFRPDPWSAGTSMDPQAAFGAARVLRGASFATHARLRSLRARGFALPQCDEGFFGFRTCSLS